MNYRLVNWGFLVLHRALPDTKGTAELCEACDPVCLVLRVEFLSELW